MKGSDKMCPEQFLFCVDPTNQSTVVAVIIIGVVILLWALLWAVFGAAFIGPAFDKRHIEKIETRTGPAPVTLLPGHEVQLNGENIKLFQRINSDFSYHALNAKQVEIVSNMRKMCLEVATYIVEVCPVSREQSVALTQLEEAMFFANAAISRHSQG